MASIAGDVADSSDARSPSTAPTPGVGGTGPGPGPGATGIKRGLDGEAGCDEKAAGDGEAGVKKKKTGSGSRGVANLTPEQLAKKRANDREAQRAIRERTKNQIETLEKRIRDLTNQKPYQELQAVVGAKQAVEQENADIKRQLANIISILKPIVGSSSPAANLDQIQPQLQHVSPGLSDDLIGPPDAHSGLYIAQLHNQKLQLRQGLNMSGERLGLDFLLRPGERVSRIQAGANGAQDSQQYHHVPMKHDWAASQNEQEGHHPWDSSDPSGQLPESSGSDGYRQAESSPSGIVPHHPGALQHHNPETNPNGLPFYAQQLKHSHPSCPLDSLLLNFLSERRQRIADGVPIREVIGPRYPSVSSLLNPSNSVYSHPLSRVFTDILSTFPGISRLPERVASLYVMFHLMRWQISPTRDNFKLIPECMIPKQPQMDYAHPAWLDLLPFPTMRERLTQIWNPRQYDLDNWFIPFTTSLRVSWPYEETDALLMLPDSDEVVINPVFERHIRNPDNWKLGERFARAFPELAGTYQLDPSIDC
ncbi:hypothetical protein VCV18_008775 [Metarhizium anisopliae]